MIDTNKKYTTRDGRKVTDLHILPEQLRSHAAYPVFAMVNGEVLSFTLDGKRSMDEDDDDDSDLIEYKEPRKAKVVFVESEGKWVLYNSYGQDCDVSKIETFSYMKHKIVEVDYPEID